MQQQISQHSFYLRWSRWLLLIMLVGGWGTGIVPRRSTAQAAPTGGVAAGETIVYVKNRQELWLIQPDGSNNRLIWQIPAGASGEIESVAWRPDAQQIAFVSSYEATCSEFGSDIYLINPDGSNLQRLTNAPACDQLANYPQGSATVQIENRLTNFSEYLVYIEGAPAAKVVNIAPNSTVLVSFPQVADLGADLMQAVVVINGHTRWFDAAVAADVTSGQNAHAGKLTISSSGFDAYGATFISWNPTGTKLAYQFGTGRLWQVGVDVPLLGEGGPLLETQTNNSVLGTFPVWSPINNEVLYQRFNTNPLTISRTEVDSADPGTDVVQVTGISGMGWLSDGSGFVAADSNALLTHSDLYVMRFADNSIVQLTQTAAGQAVVYPKVSPDNSQLVYNYVADLQTKPLAYQLRIMNIDGSEDHLLVDNGRNADWSHVAPQNPPATPQPTATPQGQPTSTATPQGQPTAVATPTATPQGQPTAVATPAPGDQPHTVFLPHVTR